MLEIRVNDSGKIWKYDYFVNSEELDSCFTMELIKSCDPRHLEVAWFRLYCEMRYRLNVISNMFSTDMEQEEMMQECCLAFFSNIDAIREMADEKEIKNFLFKEVRKKALKYNTLGVTITLNAKGEQNTTKKLTELSLILERQEDKDNSVIGMVEAMSIIEDELNEEEFAFIMFYYNNSHKFTAKVYKTTDSAVRKRVSRLLMRIRKAMEV